MTTLTIFEHDKVIVEPSEATEIPSVPTRVFAWLMSQALISKEGEPTWIKLSQLKGQHAIQVSNYVGVLRSPCGFQIEVLPKTGKNSSKEAARSILIEMLKCLGSFRHIQTSNADLDVQRMPLLEVFIKLFLTTVGTLVKRGLRSDYQTRQENLYALRGRLLIRPHISQNLFRRDRFFTEHDEFSQDRAENRLIHTALRYVLSMCRSPENQRISRELEFVFSDVPVSADINLDIQRIRLDRGMGYYEPSLAWAKLILQGLSPVSGLGQHRAPSLLFPMEALFEAYVEKHIKRQLRDDFVLKAQASSHHFVTHDQQKWFRLKPDLLIKDKLSNRMVLDTKWKLLDASKKNGREKYQLSQADFYQLYAYGHHYLDGSGDIFLIFPKTDLFSEPLPVFEFPKSNGMKLWAIPFCLDKAKLLLPKSSSIFQVFREIETPISA